MLGFRFARQTVELKQNDAGSVQPLTHDHFTEIAVLGYEYSVLSPRNLQDRAV